MGLMKNFVVSVVPAVVKPLRVLWNEIIGFCFVAFGVIFGFSLVRRYKEIPGEFSEVLGLGASIFFVLMLLAYGLYSFLRARKISRS